MAGSKPFSQNESMSRIFKISGLIPSFKHTSALLGVSKTRAGGGFILDDVTVDTWLKMSSKLIGGTPFLLLFLDFCPLPFPLDVAETPEGDLGGDSIVLNITITTKIELAKIQMSLRQFFRCAVSFHFNDFLESTYKTGSICFGNYVHQNFTATSLTFTSLPKQWESADFLGCIQEQHPSRAAVQQRRLPGIPLHRLATNPL